jgi:hypothetical protein
VLPIDGSGISRIVTERPQLTEDRLTYTFRPGTQSMPAAVAPRVLNRPHSVTADVEIAAAGAEGVLLCQGANNGGWTFFVKDRKLHYAHNYVGRAIYRVSSDADIPTGRHELRFEFEPTEKPDFDLGRGASGHAQLYVDGELVGQTEFPVTTPVMFNPGGVTCGVNLGSAIVPDYTAPFPFTGTLHSVQVDLSGELIKDAESEMRAALGRQ